MKKSSFNGGVGHDTGSDDEGSENSHASDSQPLPSNGHGSGSGAKRRAVWAMKFSQCGGYVAAGCQDGVVRVWAVLKTEEERERALLDALDLDQGHGRSGGGLTMDQLPTVPLSPTLSSQRGVRKPGGQGEKVSHMPVFAQAPVREFVGHSADVLDVSWSKNGFLLSSSMDKTVRLWHVSRPECLVVFEHSDFITAVAFHPKDDRFFISGSLDRKLRLWNIVEKRVQSWTELPDLITSVVFTSDGKLAVAGTYAGTVMFFECETLKYVNQLQAKSARGKHAKGRKVTSIVPVPPGLGRQEVSQDQVLVTSNDSRIRMYNSTDKSLLAKYKGLTNATSQIRATMSDDGAYVISGSEDRHIYIWESGLGGGQNSSWRSGKEKLGHESFLGHSSVITCALFAPTPTRNLLASAGDPIFKKASHLLGLTKVASLAPGKVAESSNMWSMEGESPADGAIIATADDHTGLIRIYRNSPLRGLVPSPAPGFGSMTRAERRASQMSTSSSRASYHSSDH